VKDGKLLKQGIVIQDIHDLVRDIFEERKKEESGGVIVNVDSFRRGLMNMSRSVDLKKG